MPSQSILDVRKIRRALLICTIPVAIALSGSALAQTADTNAAPAPAKAADADAAATNQVEEVIVTAQRRAENIQNVPVAVTAFSSAQLQQFHTNGIDALSGRVPNVNIENVVTAPGTASVNIRGFTFSDIEKSFDPPVGLVLDGVFLATNTGQLVQTFDFANVEILRGPQGTLFGRNTTGGVINITRTLPSGDNINGKVDFTFGDYGRQDYKALVNIPLVPDMLWVKIVGQSENSRGYTQNPTSGAFYGGQDYKSGTITFRFKNDWVDANLTYDRIVDLSQETPYLPFGKATPTALPIYTANGTQVTIGPDYACTKFGICEPDPLPKNVTYSDYPESMSYFLNAVTANATFHFQDFDLVSTSSYRASHESTNFENCGCSQQWFAFQRPQDYSQASEEIRAVTKFAGPFNFVAGAFMFENYYTATQNSRFLLDYLTPPSVQLPLDLTAYPGMNAKQYAYAGALYAQGDYQITDQLKLTAGARLSYDYKKAAVTTLSFTDFNFSNPTPTALGTANGHDYWTNLSPHFALDYQFTKDILGYVTYTKGYNQGGFNGRGTSSFNIGPYGPEYVDDYEIGVKTDLLDRHLRLNVNAFHTEYNKRQEPIIYNDPLVGTATIVNNAANEDMNGVEVEATAVPIAGLTITANGGFIDANYTKYYAAIISNGTAGVTDNTTLTPSRTPEYTASLSANYIMPLGPGNLLLGGDAHYTSSYFLDAVNDPRSKVGDNTILDASIGYSYDYGDTNFRLTGFVRNITDKVVLIDFVQASPLLVFGAQGEPRTFGLELSASF